jgi:hypothetical protein
VSLPGPTSPAAEPPRCSAKGCRAEAVVDLRWRNPRIHDATRVKHWLACPDHVAYLSDYLSIRGFLLETAPLAPGRPDTP